MLYKQYKLSDARTFATFFHPEKDAILTLVNQFVNKKGKFAVLGYPQKLGFLLHGPPGTGKTSFIKALAQHTNRHIVNIPLNKVKTNQELMNIMFDQKILIEGSADKTNVDLPHSRVIFVMEDVDAASALVHRRDRVDCTGETAAEIACETLMVAATAMANDSTSASTKSYTKSSTDSSITDNDSTTESPSSMMVGPLSSNDFIKDLSTKNDNLNLASLLNILDGVVDTPDRIIIMTSNHPEKLDPALVRPGRINRKLFLGNVKLAEAIGMMRHYFSVGKPMALELEDRMATEFVNDAFSPAQIESMCAEFDDPSAMVDKLLGINFRVTNN